MISTVAVVLTTAALSATAECNIETIRKTKIHRNRESKSKKNDTDRNRKREREKNDIDREREREREE